MKIRWPQGKPDENAIGAVIETAFCEEENKLIMTLALELARDTTCPSIKSFVAEVNERVIGYVSYSPIFLKSDAGISGYILAPLAVSPQHRKQGVGSQLVQRGIDVLTKEGGDVLLVYGEPAYYRRFGFLEKTGRAFMPPYPLAYPFGWTGMMLNETALPDAPMQFDCIVALSKPNLW